MFELNIRIQIAAVVFLIVLFSDFHKSRTIPTASNRYFRIMLGLNAVNLVFDFITVYTVINCDVVPFWLNSLFHRIFYLTIAGMVQAYQEYILCLDRKNKKYNKTRILIQKLPFALAVASAVFLPINFYSDHVKYAYSQGAAVSSLFIFVGFQIIQCMFFTKKLKVDKTTQGMLFTGIILWTAVCVIQFLFPNWLLTGLGITMMVTLVYLSFENTSDHVDASTKALNRFAFERVIDDTIFSKESFCITTIVIDDMNSIKTRYGHGCAHTLLKNINEELLRYKLSPFLSADNTLSVITDNDKETEYAENKLNEVLGKTWTIDDISISPTGRVVKFMYPEHIKSSGEVFEMLRYIVSRKEIKQVDTTIIAAQEREIQIVLMLKDALKNDGIDVFYQPIFSVETNRFTSAEALIRLKNYGNFKYISPEEYIPLAEQHGLILEIGKTVFRKVCSFSAGNNLTELGIKYIEVNLSGLQIIHPDLPSALDSICAEYNIDPSFINLEITETAAISSSDQMRNNIHTLLKKGYTFSLDDFGTGYSNLSKISDQEFVIIKLDKSLIWPCFDDNKSDEDRRRSSVILFSNISMIRQLGIHIVAEGAETQDMVNMLTEKGVDYIQGYFYSKPVPEDEFIKLINDKSK